MASTKKGVSKDDLKRMMKKMKSEGTIKHPMAKYNSLGHLTCTVCNCQIKSDRLWNSHLLSRSHKDNVASPQPERAVPTAAKRFHTDPIQSTNAKRHKLESDAIPARSTPTHGKPKSILKNAPNKLIAGYGSDDDPEETDEITRQPSSNYESPSAAHDLPSDFFDAKSSQPEPMDFKPTESLPENFFDDAKADAKARNVEYVDKDEVEWQKFQSEMKDQVQISDQLQAEEEEVITEDRHIEEIDEQLAQWAKVNEMVKRKTALMDSKMATTKEDDKSASDSDDSDIDSFMLDWRIKKALK